MKSFIYIAGLSLMLSACNNNQNTADAYGNFEANERLISSEANGKILQLSLEEGQLLNENQRVGQVDTTMIAINKLEIAAQRSRIYASLANIEAQRAVIRQQSENLAIEQERVKKLAASGAATQKQVDDVDGQYKVLQKQLESMNSQQNVIRQELAVLEAKQAVIAEQLEKCSIKNPAAGTVLEKYAESGEMTAMGKPLYKLASLDRIFLRVYVSGEMMHLVKLGAACKVTLDNGGKTMDGTVEWISGQAEFTPKIIQTKKDRVNLVYAVKIAVINDGSIKIGMPGEVQF